MNNQDILARARLALSDLNIDFDTAAESSPECRRINAVKEEVNILRNKILSCEEEVAKTVDFGRKIEAATAQLYLLCDRLKSELGKLISRNGGNIVLVSFYSAVREVQKGDVLSTTELLQRKKAELTFAISSAENESQKLMNLLRTCETEKDVIEQETLEAISGNAIREYF